MVAAQVLEFSTEDIISVRQSGTATRRVRAYIRSYDASPNRTINLDTYMDGAQDIEGIDFHSDDHAYVGTAVSWSGTSITVENAGTAVFCVTVRLIDGNLQF